MLENLTEYIFSYNAALITGIFFSLLVTGYGVFSMFRRNAKSRKRDEIVRERQKNRADEFTRLQLKYPLTESRIEIIELSFDDLISKLQSRELMALEVLEAYTAKTLTITEKYNCVTEFIPEAFERTKKLDKGKNIIGPLHGLPICVKDDTDVVGMDTTVGCAKNLGKPKEKNAPIVQTLINLGAIPFCKTNVPQTLLAFGSHNPVYGETVNPHNSKLSPGGSSSGSGCLIGAGGVLVGTGSDIGGSVRIPAHFNGISALRPTYRRHSSKGVAEALFPGLPGIKGVPGIMGKSSHIVATVFKSLTEGSPQYKLDNNVAPVPWDSAAFKSEEKLRIGFYTSLDYFPTIGDTEKVVLSAVTALQGKGHTLVPFQHPHTCDDWLKTLSDLIYSDIGFHFRELMDGEIVSHSIKDIHEFQFISSIFMRKLLSFAYGCFPGKGNAHKKKVLLGGVDSHSSDQLWTVLQKRRQMIIELQESMDSLELDLILGPVFPFTAPKVRETAELIYATGYTMYYNFVDFPAGVIPFGTESGDHISAYNSQDDPLWEAGKKSISNSAGMPIGVQIVGKPFKEEVVLRMMVELEGTLPGKIQFKKNGNPNEINGHNSSNEVK